MVYFEGGVWHRIQQNEPEIYKASFAKNPMGRMATPRDVANAVSFLASPCSSFTTGINLGVDGAMPERVNY